VEKREFVDAEEFTDDKLSRAASEPRAWVYDSKDAAALAMLLA